MHGEPPTIQHGGRPMTLRECMEAEEPPALQEPVAWITSPVQWATRQSEMTRKMTREKQAEFGFTTPLYAA
ncbi:MAG: hypothetical protein ACRD3M_18755, partial [Thermoanaerobaculia bacterium]